MLGSPLRAGAADPLSEELRHRREEPALLHRQLELSALRVWDLGRREWREPSGPERAFGRVLVVHLWATWCEPCKEELPWLRQVARRNETPGRDVRFLFVAAPGAPKEMGEFLQKAKGALGPKEILFEDTNEVVRRGAGADAYPITLVLDEGRVVRQALVGPLQNRINELVEAIDRLQQLPRAAKPSPPAAH